MFIGRNLAVLSCQLTVHRQTRYRSYTVVCSGVPKAKTEAFSRLRISGMVLEGKLTVISLKKKEMIA